MATYTVLVYEAEPDEGGFWATVAELPGCGTTTGETMEEVEANIRDAIEAYIEGLKASGKPLPQPAKRKIGVAVA